MRKLNDPREAVLQFIIAYSEAHSYPPSVREICKALNLKSTSTVHLHLKALEARGDITRDQNKQRAIHINQRPQDVSTVVSTAGIGPGIPIIGRVAAGSPILAVENTEGTLPLPEQLLHGAPAAEVFMLRIQGDSMINAGIFPGDLIVVNHALNCENGEICVARIEGDTVTVKRLYREKDHIRLQPENDAYTPICAPMESTEILGKVTGLLREF